MSLFVNYYGEEMIRSTQNISGYVHHSWAVIVSRDTRMLGDSNTTLFVIMTHDVPYFVFGG